MAFSQSVVWSVSRSHRFCSKTGVPLGTEPSNFLELKNPIVFRVKGQGDRDLQKTISAQVYHFIQNLQTSYDECPYCVIDLH